MPRLWVLLLFLWYYAIAIAKTDTGDSPTQDDLQRSFLQFNNNELPSDILLPLKEDIYNFQPESGTFPREMVPPWDVDPAKYDEKRKKRSLSTKDSDIKHGRNNESSGIAKREVDLHGMIADPSSDHSEEVTNIKQFSSNGVTDSVKGDVLDLLSKYQSLIDSKISHLFYNPENAYELFQKCLQPVDNKKSFNAWGGKRVFSYDDQMYKMCLESLTSPRELLQPYFFRSRLIKMPFKPWNGKRNGEDDFSPKRLPFRAWGGKREQSNEGMAPKRIPFRAWGGKRSQEKAISPVYPIADIGSLQHELSTLNDNDKREHRKKTKFYSWGGKRSVDKRAVLQPSSTDLLNPITMYGMQPWRAYNSEGIPTDIHTVTNRRMKFNSWGGKPSESDDKLDEDKRTFNPWGGKRSSKTADDNEGAKRRFNAWGGKRTFNAWGGKRTFNAWGGKRSFNAWGGKRSDLDDSILEDSEGKRTFNAWGGKRGILESTPQFDDRMYGLDLENDDRLMNEADKRTFNAWGGK